MKKKQVVDYLRSQASWINYLAQEIEDGKEITCQWAVDLEVPEFQAEVKAIHEQLKLNAELHTAVEELRA